MSGDLLNPNDDQGSQKRAGEHPQPVPEGTNLLGSSEREKQRTDAGRRAYALGPFGQTWLWVFGGILSVAGLYKLIVGPLLAATLPTTKGVVLDWILIPARTITYVPKIAYEVGGKTHEFIAGSTVSTLTGAPKTVTVSYVPFDPSTAIWNDGNWWQPLTDVYLMVCVILGLILFCVAIYERSIRSYWKPRAAAAGASAHRVLIWLGVVGLVAGGIWLLSGYLAPASWFIPPNPNVIAAFITAIGAALLATGLHYRAPASGSRVAAALSGLSAEQRTGFDAAIAKAKRERRTGGAKD